MADTVTFSPSRRFVLGVVGFGAAGFAVGCDLRAADATSGPVAQNMLGPYVRVGSDNTVTVFLRHLEMGQGVSTGLTTIVAEEIDADWSQMRFEHSPADDKLYGNPAFGGMMGTGGSTAILSSWEQLRAAGASAREMLRQAAAKKWSVDASTVTVAKGEMTSGNHKATFGELAAEASALTPPDPKSLKYKEASAYEFIGKERDPAKTLGRLDTPGKVHATAQYALDYHPEGTLTAVIARSPKFGGKVASFDDTGAKAVAGVTDVVQVPNGVAESRPERGAAGISSGAATSTGEAWLAVSPEVVSDDVSEPAPGIGNER